MKRSVLGASSQMSQLVEALRTSLGFLVDERQDVLWDLARSANDAAKHAAISRQISRYFPDYFAFTIADNDGNVLYDDLGERVGEFCLADIREFARSGHVLQLVIHPGPGEYHFDVMLPWRYHGEDVGVFFASFKPGLFAHLLQNSEVAGHSLVVLRKDVPDLIEITGQGSRPEIKQARSIRLSRDELDRIVFSSPVRYSQWVLADLPSETLFSDYAARVRNESLGIFAGFVLVSIVMLMLLRREEGQRTAAEAALRESHKQLEHANISKSRFLRAASHDLRQPMHALGLFIDQLRAKVRGREARAIVDQAQASINALDDLFDSVLDISKLDAGVLTPNLKGFPVDALLQRMESEFGEAARSKGLRFRVRPSDLIVRSDPALLERIVLNLVSNAVRYTSSGGILVACRRRGDRARIEVWDTGRGIPVEQQEDIFSEFFRVEGESYGRGKGLGLGLTIVRRLAELLEHRVELLSTPGRGSVFGIEVPVDAQKAAAGHARSSPLTDDLAGAFMLVIDDDLLVQDGMRSLFSSWRCHVVTAGGGDEAVAALREHDRLPDVIICDYWLPGDETGIQVIERLKSQLSAEIPAVLISADASPERLREAGEHGYPFMGKPVKPARLRALLSQVLSKAREAKPAA